MYSIKVLSRGFRDHKEGLLDNLQSRHGADSRRMSMPKQISSSNTPAGSVGSGAASSSVSALGGVSASISVSTGRVLESFPPVFVYCLVIQETLVAGTTAESTTGNSDINDTAGAAGRVTRILTGGSDGRIKVGTLRYYFQYVNIKYMMLLI